jgi:hypothetical protein
MGLSEEDLRRCQGDGDVSVDPFREVIAVHPEVVDSDAASNEKAGPLSFRALMEALAPNNVNAGEFVERWLREFEVVTSVNGFAVPTRRDSPRRPAFRAFLEAWPRTPQGHLDLAKAPFKLLAVTSRLDLRNPSRGRAGEAHYVFSGGDSFTVIFEYALPEAGSVTARTWAQRWHALGRLPMGPAYAEKLGALTQRIVQPAALSGATSRSSLLRLRTNEIQFAVSRNPQWQMREFTLAPASKVPTTERLDADDAALEAPPDGFFRQTTVASTPDGSLDGRRELTTWLQDHEAEVLAGTAKLPKQWLGGVAEAKNFGKEWTFPVASRLNEAFSLNTCDGCHRRDGNRDGFYHVSPSSPRGADGTGILSDFLKNQDVPRRVAALKRALCTPAGRPRATDPEPFSVSGAVSGAVPGAVQSGHGDPDDGP